MKKLLFVLGILFANLAAFSQQPNTSGRLLQKDTSAYKPVSPYGGVFQIIVDTYGNPYYWNGSYYRALQLSQATSKATNTNIGDSALRANTTGTGNTALGKQVLKSNTTGSYNTGAGYRTLFANTTGSNNTAVGDSAGYSNATGKGNIFLGAKAGGAETGDSTVYIDNSNTATPLIKGDLKAAVKKATINGTLEITGPVLMTAGANKSIGTATLSSGTVTVSNTRVTASSIIKVGLITPGGTIGIQYGAPAASKVNGTSFVINAYQANGTVLTTDTSTVWWEIIN